MMRLILLTALTMTAFAANSILNRLAVDTGAIDSGSFATIRVAAGAAMLVALLLARGGALALWTPRRIVGAGSLTVYMVGFSLAYRTLDAGLGALLLFGVVQITMFVLSALRGAPATARQIAGSVVAFAGLAWVLWPGTEWAGDPQGAFLMALAGAGWAVYTLAGRAEPDALAATAANFCAALPLTALATWLAAGSVQAWAQVSASGLALAVLSGAVTSGLGYALWYSIVPRLDPAIAAIVQLCVPVIAMAAGVVLLGEVASPRLMVGTALVIGGIGYALRAPRRR